MLDFIKERSGRLPLSRAKQDAGRRTVNVGGHFLGVEDEEKQGTGRRIVVVFK